MELRRQVRSQVQLGNEGKKFSDGSFGKLRTGGDRRYIKISLFNARRLP
jgi:hypothetical protein